MSGVALLILSLLLINPSLLTNVSIALAQDENATMPAPKPKPKPKPTHTQPVRHPATHSTPNSSSRSTPRQSASNIEMVFVQGGTFMMGSPDGVGSNDEHSQHQVSVQSFYMGKYEVTQAQYQAVMGTNPSYFKGDIMPVERVSWNDAMEFCRRLSRMTGREYRLPSEAEWEYACRAGTTGDYAGNLDSMAWYGNNSGGQYLDAAEIWQTDSGNYLNRIMANGNQTRPVGYKQSNEFGLYDMHGNVLEWCEDWYQDNYDEAPTDGSAWLSGGGRYRVMRGGSWYSIAPSCRSAYRDRDIPDNRHGNFGFRVVALVR